jgi:4-amino-4-deoxy-L-arabinose transferase-like glycosyltransferase
MPYWITSTLAATPALIWMFIGVGLPWALVTLPRHDWRGRVMVACLTLAFGPALLTAWMFVIGSVQSANLLKIEWVLLGTAVIALVGWLIAWRKRIEPPSRQERQENKRLQFDERLLILLVVVALIVRWIGVAYWPTTAYDALWVYGFEGRLYTLVGHIPTTIEYYPQFLPLQHTFLQLAAGGIDDHAARAVLPWLQLGSILAVYVMGNRLFSRRVGIYAAAIWALYPHMGEWSRYGDLEVPVTFMFTGAAAFFVMAWTNTFQPQRHKETKETQHTHRYAVIAGLFLGIGLWTKPTMGAFVWGVVLVVAIAVVIVWWQMRQTGISVTSLIQRLRPQIEVVVITGLVCIPLGGMWYVRNMLLGHQAIIFPDAYWQTLAARSGVEFGWPLLALIALVVWVIWKSRQSSVVSQQSHAEKPMPLKIWLLVLGLVLVAAGVWPSIYNSGRIGITDDRMGLWEWLALAAGLVIVGITLWRWARGRWTDEVWATAAKIGWLWALGLPYFITWFYSYSYHYRLSFAIVPLMIMPIAVIVVKLRDRLQSIQTRVVALIGIIVIIALAIPGIINPLYDSNAGWDWLWTDKLPDDHARYTSGNAALMNVVDGLQKYVDEHPNMPLRVVAPQVKRLPFFFPTADIEINTMPTQLSQLNGVTYFIYGKPEAGGDFNTFIPGQNQVLSALSLATTNTDVGSNIMRRAWGDDDGIFKYTVYELHLENRFKPPEYINGPTTEGDVQFGRFVRLLGYDVGGLDMWPGRKVTMHLFWQVIEKPKANYMIFIHLRDKGGNVIQAWDGPVSWTHDGNMYSTLVWDAGEYIVDERQLTFDGKDVPQGNTYKMVVGMYDLATQQRVPMTINGQAAGEGYTIAAPFSVVPVPKK